MGKKRGLSPLQVSEWQTLPFYGPMVDIPLADRELFSERRPLLRLLHS